tara:strand:+ start:749 stop:1312 length:564 start_codon:yes stop_codon:yes gene_type:complete
METSNLQEVNKQLNSENERLLDIIRDLTSKMEKVTKILKNNKDGKVDLNLIYEYMNEINSINDKKKTMKNKSNQKTKSPVKKSIYDDTNTDTSLKNKKTVSRSFHSKECNCFSCDVADLSNQLYYICTDYVKEDITEKRFKQRAIKALNECDFIKNIVSKNTHDMLTIYKLRYQLLRRKYNELTVRK